MNVKGVNIYIVFGLTRHYRKEYAIGHLGV
jgi:hypothetical protein